MNPVDGLHRPGDSPVHRLRPQVKIVALAAGPKTMAAALKAGATVVLPRSTPPATLAKVIQRLAKKPSKPAH